MNGRLAYALAALIFGASLIGYTVTGLSFTQMNAVRLQEIADAIAAMPRVPVPGQSDVHLPEPGDYTVFLETESGLTENDPPELRIKLEAEDGGLVQIRRAEHRISYEFDRSGVSVHKFQISRPGRYRVVSSYPEGSAESPAVLAFGMGLESRIGEAVAHGAWWLLWATGIAVAVVIAALTYFRQPDSVPDPTTGTGPSPE